MNPLFSRFFKNLVFQELFNTKNIFIQEWMINCNLLVTLSFLFIFSNIKEESDSSSLSFKLSFSNYHLRFQLHQHFTRHPIHMHQRSSSFDFPITFSLQPKYTLQDTPYTYMNQRNFIFFGCFLESTGRWSLSSLPDKLEQAFYALRG